jgi:hypothetical protein
MTYRRYLDFTVDGQSIGALTGAQSRDLIGRLGWCPAQEDRAAVEQLLLRQPARLPNARQLLYVCPECGDIGCGAITALVELDGDAVTWRDFGYENDYDANMTQSFQGVGPFRFSLRDYQDVLARALEARDA